MRDVTTTHDRVRHIGGFVLAVVVAITVASLVTDPDDPAQVIPAGAAVAGPPDPIEQLLTAQATALTRGDQTGWLKPVAPSLRKRYLDLFRSLRALHVTTVDYRITTRRQPTVQVELSYCFVGARCPKDGPKIAQKLTIKSNVIVVEAAADRPTDLQPTPWESGDLVFAQGKRVTVGAPPALRSRLKEITKIADSAAVVDDRFAAYAGNRQPRYRLFLATEKLWRSWYGGKATNWAVGYMQPLGAAGADVVINPGRLTTTAALREVIQHELGHVATIAGVTSRHEDMWLVEGVAEYIGSQPRRAYDTYNREALTKPKALAARPLRDGADDDEVAAFYAQGHFAVDCLVTAFGEPRAMEFVRQRLRLSLSLDDASRSAFGTDFRHVTTTCVDWMSHQVG
ncbi:hypothetical protein GCM10010172_13540 [Paractinoplanes ferrugineus]|uniref:Peptidase MA-like domain-containing protein n=1 Tax=Paractinoplanes ferrugineus TaxID=113564 RepID=A0A919MCW3_9ACTN|nr:hypothetical protein [Actinoplanes ferrugineus]GIE09919.1 hypothetical protein Afe05nite_17590 [Actinoplanes ferrugineus]